MTDQCQPISYDGQGYSIIVKQDVLSSPYGVLQPILRVVT